MNMGIISASRLRGSDFPSSGIIHRYLLNETTGTTANDSIGSENGIIKAGVTLGVDGYEAGGKAYEFDGANNSYVSFNAYLGGLSNFTIYIRIRKNVIDSSTIFLAGWLGSNAIIIRTTANVGDEAPSFTTVTNNGRIDLGLNSRPVSLDWVEYVVSYNGAIMTINVDGDYRTASQTGTLNPPNELRLGQLNSSLPGEFDCDEFIVWDRALSEVEQNQTFII